MDTITQIIRNSAYSLVIFCIISIVIRLIFSIVDYKNESISFSVKKTGAPTEEIIKEIHFTAIGVGKVEMKPTFIQSVILSENIYRDGGATMLFYLISSFTILWSIKGKEIHLENVTEKKIAKILWIGLAFFLVPKILFEILLDQYISNLTHGMFEHYDSSSFFDSCIYIGIILFNAAYGFIEYAKKLKQDVDLTI